MPYLSYQSPAGALTVFEEAGSIVAIDWGSTPNAQFTPLLERAQIQLDAYFNGSLKDFDLPLRPTGTEFQIILWNQLLKIPYGSVLTYGDLAKDLNSAARAVGGACGQNPIPIIIPCHRVISANGQLTGYTGGNGIDTKRALLRLEGYQPL
jgi:methylated-DNA-[protein]-cysteine S-methyltransferase